MTGKIHVHERDSVNKAKAVVKKLGLSHNVIQGKIQEEYDELDEGTLNLLWEMSNQTFTGLVKGYLAHKRRAKVGGFKPLSFDKFHETVKKINDIKEQFLSSKEDMQITEDIELYNFVEQKMNEENKISLPAPKVRNTNYLTLINKKNASGKHKDKKKESKNGESKYKQNFE